MLFWNDPLEEQGDRKWGWGSCECQRREKPLGGGGGRGEFFKSRVPEMSFPASWEEILFHFNLSQINHRPCPQRGNGTTIMK